MKLPMELYACLYVKEFPAQALLRLRPELHGKPCVVLEGEAPLQAVCSLNTKARLLGMTHGMTPVEVDTFPASVVLPRSLKAESLTKAVLLECAGAFSPRVEDSSEDRTFLCGIDIAGTGNLFGPPEMLARSLLQRLRSLGISARITVSRNLHAATHTHPSEKRWSEHWAFRSFRNSFSVSQWSSPTSPVLKPMNYVGLLGCDGPGSA